MNIALLLWILLLAPLISAAMIALFAKFSSRLSAFISVSAVLVSFVASWLVFFVQGPVAPVGYNWIEVGNFAVPIGFIVDRLSQTMLIVVTTIGALIHIYSLGYMAGDPGRSRYFGGLSLFMFSMLGIVLANNFVMMFIFWELVGVSSYMLIGHWFTRPAAAAAANKAFIVNRIGDFGFMLGILMVWLAAGSILFADIQEALPLAVSPGYMTAAVLLVFCGAVGKSAQFPLHVWLPDAMEGPTPVSALIHAATMVAAGVYMLARVFFLVEASPNAAEVIAWIGIVTAVMAALMATQQSDIKRILAYSTLSQLGLMVVGIGVATSGNVAMFHLFTHAFFKALLFLGAGAVIYSLHHEQDIWKMGGLKNKMPLTFLTFGAGTLALAGFPYLFSGFYSKDAILIEALARNPVIFWLGLFVSFLTSFYMFRLFFVVFLGAPRSNAAKVGHESPAVMTLPLVLLAIPSVIAGYPFIAHIFFPPHEAVHGANVPLLASGVFLAGLVGAVLLYRNKTRDPISIPLFRERFYIDELYLATVGRGQDALGALSAAFDRWIVDGVFVRGASAAVYGFGFVLRFLQVGNLQAYSFLFGLGAVALIYLIIFR